MKKPKVIGILNTTISDVRKIKIGPLDSSIMYIDKAFTCRYPASESIRPVARDTSGICVLYETSCHNEVCTEIDAYDKFNSLDPLLVKYMPGSDSPS